MKTQLPVFVSFICLALVSACGDDSGTDPDPDSGVDDAMVTGTSYKYVASQIRIGELIQSGEQSIAPGFNLDGETDNPCNQNIDDYVSPNPDNEAGVDNQLITIASEVKSFDATLDFDALLESGIMSGNVAILVEVVAEDLTNGPATVTFYTGDFDGEVQWDGTALEPGQNFTTRTAVTSATGTITNGRLEVDAATLPVTFPAESASTGSVSLTIAPVKARFTISATALTNGFIGGAINSQSVVDEVMKFEENFGQGIDREFVESAVLPKSDMQPAADGQSCEAISAGLYIEGATANF